MSWRRSWMVLACVIGLTLSSTLTVLAVPPLPTTLYGRARWGDHDLSAGTRIAAWLNGAPVAQGVVVVQGTVIEQRGEAWYVLEVPGDAAWVPTSGPPPEAGAVITFTLAGQPAAQTTQWSAGKLERLDLRGDVELLYLPLIRSERVP